MHSEIKIHELTVGGIGRIKRYNVVNSFTERLQELGLTPGTVFTLVRQAPWGGPVEIRFGQSRLALRPAEDSEIVVERVAV